jgi:hypothetical protein
VSNATPTTATDSKFTGPTRAASNSPEDIERFRNGGSVTAEIVVGRVGPNSGPLDICDNRSGFRITQTRGKRRTAAMLAHLRSQPLQTWQAQRVAACEWHQANG